MRYLITGATGFIGPYLIRRLQAEGHFCRCLVRPQSDTSALAHTEAELVAGDITRADSIRDIAEGMDRVLHLATLGHMSNYVVTDRQFEAINVDGALNVMREALRARVPRVVHCSTVAAMGICPETPATEQSPCRPHHAYGRSKLKAEKAISAMIADEGLQFDRHFV